MRALLLLLALLLARPAAAGELKLATWNLNWLTLRPAGDTALPEDVHPRAPGDFAKLRAYALALDADVVAFEEVDGAQAAAEVFPPDRYTLAIAGDAVVQRVGFAIRRGLRFTRNPDLRGLDTLPPDAPHRLRSGADITLDLPDGKLRLLAVHLKTGCWSGPLGGRHARPACGVLRAQIPVLQDWIAARAAEGVPFAVLGDFNRRMEGRDAVLRDLDRADPLRRADEGFADPCWGGSDFIDHILAGGKARDWLVPDSLRVLVYRETDPIWKERLSDHCPISVRLRTPG